MPETIQARCPNCRAALKVPAAVAGKKIRCKNCQTVFTAPAAGAAFTVADDAPRPGTARPVNPAPPADARPKGPYDDLEDTGPTQYGVTKDVDDTIPRCPFCAKELDPPDTKICLNCGYDLLERRRHESKKVYELTAGDYVKHHAPAVACLVIVGILVAVCTICILFMGDWFAGSIFEQDETDPNTGKKKFWIPPGFCTTWIVVPSLFVIWKCGKFAFKRLVFQWKPPDKIKK